MVSPLLEDELEDLHFLELDLALVLVFGPQQLDRPVAPIFVVIAVQSEVRKQFLLLRFDPHLRVAENQKVVVVDRRLPTLLREVVALPVAQRDEHSLSPRRRLRLEEPLRVGRDVLKVAELQHHHQLLLLVDVPVQVHLVLGVEAVDQAGVRDPKPHQLFDRSLQEQFVLVFSPQSFPVEQVLHCGQAPGSFGRLASPQFHPFTHSGLLLFERFNFPMLLPEFFLFL